MRHRRDQPSSVEVLSFVVMFVALSLANPLGVLFWLIVAAACVVAFFALADRRRLPGASCPCVYCGYDLRHLAAGVPSAAS